MNLHETDDYISSLKLFIQNEFRNEILDKCGIPAGDCLVCLNAPSENCPICSSKVLKATSDSTKRRSSSAGIRRNSSVLNSSTISGGSYSTTNLKRSQTAHMQNRFNDTSRLRTSSSNLRASRERNNTSTAHHQEQSNAATTSLLFASTNAKGVHQLAEEGDQKKKQLQVVNDYAVFLKRQLEKNETDRRALEAEMNDYKTRNVVLAEENKLLREKLHSSRAEVMHKEAALKELRDQIEGYASTIDELKKMVSLSEACRSNTARALAKWRKEKGIALRQQQDSEQEGEQRR